MELCSLLEISPSDGNQSASFVFNKMTARNSQKHPDSNRVFALRRYLVGFLFILIFVLLDRTMVYLQILPGISAWYPPMGIAPAFLIGMGPQYAPLYWLTGLIAAKVSASTR